ncbi:MAG: ribose-phosphate diphosphokinase [Candidatus Nanoarchaeia archaeon]|nr:ribose-phosphate diphosphokinase [Candidatus Nanoarchaeia archaeon]
MGFKDDAMIFALSSSKKFGERIGYNAEATEMFFPDEEFRVHPDSSLDMKGKDVFVIQSIHKTFSVGGRPELSTKLLQLLIFCDSAHRAGSARITAVIPYFGFARQDRPTETNDSESAKATINFLKAAYVDRILAVDLHNPKITKDCGMPFYNLLLSKTLVEHLAPVFNEYDKFALIAPDKGAMDNRTGSLEAEVRRVYPDINLITGYAKKVRKSGSEIECYGLELYGKSLKERATFTFDDETVTGSTILNVGRLCKEAGAATVIGGVSHCKASRESAQTIQKSDCLDRFIISDTVSRSDNFFKEYPKIEEISASGPVYAAIRDIHEHDFISAQL